MNKREAKIEALQLAYWALENAHSQGLVINNASDQEYVDKVTIALNEIINSIVNRLYRLGADTI